MISHNRDDASTPEDKRRFRRATLSAVVDLSRKASHYTGYTENISEGGVFVATPEPLPIGEPLDLRLHLRSGGDVVVRARVAWVRKARADGPPAGMGLQFVSVPEEVREDIRRFVEDGTFDVLLWHTD